MLAWGVFSAAALTGQGPGGSIDYATEMPVDARGNVVVTSRCYEGNSSADGVTVALDSLGNERWVARYDGPSAQEDPLRAVPLGAGGNVYVAGTRVDGDTGYDFLTVKYSPAGLEEPVARYDGSGGREDTATALAFDGQGCIYVAGWSVFTAVSYRQLPDGVKGSCRALPLRCSLAPAYPNLFDEMTAIVLCVSAAAPLTLRIFDVRARETAVLADEVLPTGTHRKLWGASDMPSGVHICVLEIREAVPGPRASVGRPSCSLSVGRGVRGYPKGMGCECVLAPFGQPSAGCRVGLA